MGVVLGRGLNLRKISILTIPSLGEKLTYLMMTYCYE